MRALVRLPLLGTRGVAAIEFVLVFPVFLTLVFGILETSRLMWQQVSLQRGVATAARCGALGTIGCVSDLEIRNKAVSASAMSGLSVSNITVNRAATCGVQVAAARQFTFFIKIRGISPITISAQACHPILK